MMNARQTPKLASPRANIAGSQTNKFITASYVPLGRLLPGSGSFGKWRTGAETKASAFAAPARLRRLATAAAFNGSASFPLYFDEVS